MKELIAGVIAFFILGGRPCGSAEQGNIDPLERLTQLYKAHRYFELRDALAGTKGEATPGLAFFRAIEAGMSNRLNEAMAGFLAYLQDGPAEAVRPFAKDAWTNLADSYRRAGLYRKAGETYRLILDRFGGELEAGDKANYENQADMWSALAGVPAQTVEVSGDSDIPLERRSFPVFIRDKAIYVWYDTGASVSVLYESAARDLGLAPIGSGITIQSGTGRRIESRFAVVPEMRFGNVIVRNAVFLVLPDTDFPVREIRPGIVRRGLIGVSTLVALKELIETREGRLLIPAAPRPRASRNILLYGFRPLVEVLHRGDRLVLSLDSGAAQTFLYPPFFRRYGADIEARSKLREITMGGVGPSRKVAVHVLDAFGFRVAGLDLSLPKIMVHTEETHADSRRFDGVLGADVFPRCARMIFDFASLSFVLE